ncbi:hypothetical protein AB0I28_04535 [Phytomonospora sp. NPDC050363]|uniref:hypothetical protein n=1 Tax=Phytomonospora sp. NPDC050363 TaxID=3155642 RepID=UPI0033C1F205
MAKPEYKEFVRAYLHAEHDRADAIRVAIHADDQADFHLFLGAFLSVMLDKRFGGSFGVEDIRVFVREMEYDYRNNPNPINPRAVEGFLRAINGEERFFDEFSMEEQVRAQFLIITKIAVQDPAVLLKLDEYLAKADADHAEMVRDLGV